MSVQSLEPRHATHALRALVACGGPEISLLRDIDQIAANHGLPGKASWPG